MRGEFRGRMRRRVKLASRFVTFARNWTESLYLCGDTYDSIEQFVVISYVCVHYF